MNAATRFPNRRGSAGFTMVEIMIAVLIGLIGIVVIMQVYAVSEGYKRTTTTGTDAQINGAIGLYQIEKDLRVSAFGIGGMFNTPTPMCTSIIAYNAPQNVTMNIKLTPFDFNPPDLPAGDPNTDVLVVFYGSTDSVVVGADMAVGQGNSSTNPIQISDNPRGYRNGDLVIGYGLPSIANGNTPVCVLHELTAVPDGSGNCGQTVTTPGFQPQLSLGISSGTYPDPNNSCKPKNVTWNAPAGLTLSSGVPVPPLKQGDKLFSLGASGAWRAYAVRGGNLTMCDRLLADCRAVGNWQVIVQNIVSLRTIYAMRPVAGGPVTWTRNGIVGGSAAGNMMGVAVALVAKSTLAEKPTVGPGCDATVNRALPDAGQANPWYQQYMGATDATIVNAAIDLSTSAADWQCYRYKLFQTAVPVRNMTWKP